jgi:hypothetical protein
MALLRARVLFRSRFWQKVQDRCGDETVVIVNDEARKASCKPQFERRPSGRHSREPL